MSFETSRDIAADPAQVFAAFDDAERMACWWGPAGFTNTFHSRQFKTGGAWSYTMHGPGGKNYPNESVFKEITPAAKIVIEHISQPKYVLTISLEPNGASGTRVHWQQIFDDPRVAAGIAHIVMPANEQNLDRLAAEVLRATTADKNFR